MVVITAFYKFAHIEEPRLKALHMDLEHFLESAQILGLVLISKEGINGTVAGSAEAIESLKSFLDTTPEFKGIIFKDSSASFTPFKRLKVDIRDEIVTLKRPDIVPVETENHHLTPKEWHEVLTGEDRDFVLIDTRNTYEVEIGKFKGAIDPETEQFSEFPSFVDKQNFPKDKKILMYCTGGIRCEKALVEMQQKGFKNVYQLEGGILNYLQQYPDGEWDGECFIFDHRVALDKNLRPTEKYHLCPHCGNPGDVKTVCGKCSEPAFICKRCQSKPFLETCSKNCANHLKRLS